MGELMRISVIGTGNMGGAIASALYDAEYEVAVYDKAAEKAEKLAEEHEGMIVLPSIEDASGSGVILPDPVPHHLNGHLIRNKAAGCEDTLHLLSQLCAILDILSEDISC